MSGGNLQHDQALLSPLGPWRSELHWGVKWDYPEH
jgi:hypothetical protein